MIALNAIPGAGQAKALWAVAKGWVLLGAAISLIGAGFYAGHHWASGETQAALRKADKATMDAGAWKQASEGWKGVADHWQAKYNTDEKTRKEYADQAQAILKRLATMEEAARARKAKWDRDFEAAKRNPNCAELLKETTCSVFAGY